jgi:hypothetical protein
MRLCSAWFQMSVQLVQSMVGAAQKFEKQRAGSDVCTESAVTRAAPQEPESHDATPVSTADRSDPDDPEEAEVVSQGMGVAKATWFDRGCL